MNNSIIYILLLLLLFTNCSENQESENVDDASSNLIQLTEDQIAFNGIEVGTIRKGPVYHKVKATGRVDVPPNFTLKISAPLDAYVERIYILPGDSVKKGEVLARLRHPSIAEIQKQYHGAKARLAYVEEDLQRKSELVSGNTVSAREYQEVKSEAISLRANLESIVSELNRLGIDPKQLKEDHISQFLLLRSPIDAIVTDLYKKSSEFSGAEEPMVSLLNREHEHIEVEVFQKDLSKLRKGMPVRMSLPADENAYSGEIFLINSQLDPRTLSTNVHVHPGDNFPGVAINSTVFVEILYKVDTTYRMPKSEIINEGGTHFLFKKNGDGYSKTEIFLGQDDGEFVEISGPKEVLENQVVTVGNYYLNGI